MIYYGNSVFHLSDCSVHSFDLAYANLMKSMWAERSDSHVSPNAFKTQIQRFAPRFMGYAYVYYMR